MSAGVIVFVATDTLRASARLEPGGEACGFACVLSALSLPVFVGFRFLLDG